MKTNVVIVSLAMIAATMAVAGTAHASPEPEPSNEQCTNYGVFQQITVTGDNSYECYAQYCVQGDNVPVSAGVGFGWAASTSDVTTVASAGSECNNGTNSTADFREFFLEVG